ncbi:indolylacetylinositol arabinosyltransferase [Pseudonocardia sp. EV170527-09]|uniref:arabinosyltransferase domain-containing protein n=1 Tax=Pseudonocardia sp. EV170527-09 TaxID=2603411 RepID=UPI0011F15A22|nr:arabinosyltransferase domain-containing protein [Pseudonocardia sp. EV170527-09]KAA1036067.1 indolylacetylinositol arabinosyltransferase [Pseudonocardia sp. EV170527-09]
MHPSDRSAPSSVSRRLVVATLVAGLLAGLCAALVPFAPVDARTTTVSWPRAGERPTSTTAAFQPAAPEAVHVEVPCRVLRAAQIRSAGTGAATTVVGSERSGAPGTGFAVLTGADEELRVQVGGRELLRAPVPSGDACGLVLDTDEAGSRVTLGDGTPRAFPGDIVRAVAAFSTQLSPADADGLRVTARTADWFAAASSPAKTALLGLQWLAAAVAAVLLARLAGDRFRRRRGTARVRRARLAAVGTPAGIGRAAADVLVVATLAGWTVLGPLSTDDGFTEAIARNATGTATGDFGNVYRWGNASEAPYTLVIRLVRALAETGVGPLVLRLPSVLAGIAVWLLLSRVALPAVLARHHRRAWVRGTLGVALLAWWLPLNLGGRPEPFAALATTAALCCALRAAARPGLRGGTWTAAAALTAGLALAVTPSAVTVAGPLVLLVPALWRQVTRHGGGGLAVGVAATVAAAGIAAAGLTPVFTGQSLYTVARATEMHQFYGPATPWFQELRRWDYLLGFGTEQGGLGRRVPVLLALALLVAALPLVARGAHRWGPGLRWTPVPLVGLALGFVLLTPAPSKWTHYFGTLAGTGALAAAAGVVLVVTAARRPADPTVRGAAAAGTLAAAVLAALAFSGRNEWFLWSGWGVPRADGPFTPLNSPAVWALVALAVLVVSAAAVHRAGRRAGLGAGRRAGHGRHRTGRDSVARAAAALPAGVVVVALLTGVSVVVASFVVAPVRQGGGYSVGGQLWSELTGRDTCGILDHVTVGVDGGALPAAGGADTLTGFTEGRGWVDAPPRGGLAWGSLDGGPGSTGELRSRWFAVTPGPPDRVLSVDVAGRTGQGNTLELEYARAGSPGPDGRVSLDDTATGAGGTYPAERVQEAVPLDRSGWRTVRVPVSALPVDVDRVRVHAVDTTVGPGGWVAAAAPRVVTSAPVVPMLRDADGPVYVDWSILWAAPCLRDLPAVRAGLVQTPRYLVLGPSSLGFAVDVSFADVAGGSFAAMRRTTTEQVVATRIDTADVPGQADWGAVIRIDTDLAVDAYDVSSAPVRRWGWEGDRSPIGYPALPTP